VHLYVPNIPVRLPTVTICPFPVFIMFGKNAFTIWNLNLARFRVNNRRFPTHPIVSQYVDFESFFNHVVRDVQKSLSAHDPSIVYYNINVSHVRFDNFGILVNVFFVRHVHRICVNFVTFRFYFFYDFFQS
jgi:hypothetical protein